MTGDPETARGTVADLSLITSLLVVYRFIDLYLRPVDHSTVRPPLIITALRPAAAAALLEESRDGTWKSRGNECKMSTTNSTAGCITFYSQKRGKTECALIIKQIKIN